MAAVQYQYYVDGTLKRGTIHFKNTPTHQQFVNAFVKKRKSVDKSDERDERDEYTFILPGKEFGGDRLFEPTYEWLVTVVKKRK